MKYVLFCLVIVFWSCEESKSANDDIVDFGIVINEINYNSSDNFNTGDWVELYNNSDQTIDLSFWLLKDDNNDHIFIVPQNTFLLPNQFIIFCKDTIKFKNLFPSITAIYGDFDFGFGSDNDFVRLFDSTGALTDKVEYMDEFPWPILADGDGPTLELINPSLDNSLPHNWSSSEGYGTPGEVNSVYTNDD